MNKKQPLVSIGIPTYNRAIFLKRSIESALNQDYANIEVIVSDNASSDRTSDICHFYCDKDTRLKYFRHSENLGPAKNFDSVIEKSTGQYFMWLGDDDWIDENYISSCIQQFIIDPKMSLVSGAPKYYHIGLISHDGKMFDLLHDVWWQRVIYYYWLVADNGMFYGLMKSSQIKQIKMQNVMGGDWHLIANMTSFGKAKIIQTTSVHRELGGATASYRKIALSLGISKIHAIFPMTSIAASAWLDIMGGNAGYRMYSFANRMTIACAVFFVIMTKSVLTYFNSAKRKIKKYFKN